MAPFKVIIVGGGLAGSLLANGLVNDGVDVVVYERDTADSKREGYQIRLGEPAYTGFEACLTDDHRAAVLSKLGQTSGEVNTAPSLVNSRFETILDMSQFPSYSKSAAINRVVLRNILLDPIAKLGRVKFGKKLVKYEIVADAEDNEHVEVQLSDGSVDTCDVLVGADGSGSKVSEMIVTLPLYQLISSVDKSPAWTQESCANRHRGRVPTQRRLDTQRHREAPSTASGRTSHGFDKEFEALLLLHVLPRNYNPNYRKD